MSISIADTNIIVCHVRKHEHDTYIGRRNRGLNMSIWANPFTLTDKPTAQERRYCLRQYNGYVLRSRHLVERLEKGELIGKRLACWCYQEPSGPEAPEEWYCHGDVLRQLQTDLYKAPPIIEANRDGFLFLNFTGKILPFYHCCLHCGYTPVEGMQEFRLLHGFTAARCSQCGYNLSALELPFLPFIPQNTDKE